MSDLATMSREGQAGGDNNHASPSAGALLKQARDAAGLHIGALAVALKVPVKKLEALESDRFDLLPDAVFVRALASSVCRTLKIDATPVLQRLPKTSNLQLAHPGAGINAAFRAAGDGSRLSISSQISRPAVLAGLILLLCALVLIFLPAIKVGVNQAKFDLLPGTPDDEPGKLAAMPHIAEAEAARALVGNREPVSPATAALLTDPRATSSALASYSVTSAPQLRPTASLAQAIAAPGDSASAALTSTGIVVFSAKSASWVEVRDSTSRVVLRRMLNAGEVVGATGPLPLAVIVGRADVTGVQVRGKDFDLSAVAKDNIARFEVK